MLDINYGIRHQQAYRHDPDGNMAGLVDWSRECAKEQAAAEGLGELTEAHWRVIHTLRGLYRQHGPASSASNLIREIEKDFADEGGRRFLYQLFPKGPINQGCRLAGVPVPPYANDPSFGSFG